MQKKRNEILFLNLYAFSLTGGVEKVSRKFIYAIGQLLGTQHWMSYSMHDEKKNTDISYIAPNRYKTFGGAKLSFVASSFLKGLKSNVLVLSHINLLPVAKLIKLFKPKQRIIMFAHGIEVWDALPKWKTKFLQDKVQIWAVSNYTRDKMIAQHQISPQQIKVLNNSLSPFIQLPHHFEKPQHLLEKYQIGDVPVIFTLNRLSASEKYKGYDKVITALGKLKQQNQAFIYLLAGKADDAEHIRLTKLIEDNNLANEVKMIGYLSEEELTPHFLLSDLFIMPSKGEGFGIVFIEAAAHGCKVIGGNIDGSTDALLNGKLGQLINPNEETEILQAIQNALADKAHQPHQQQQMTIEHFGFDSYLKKVKELLNHPVVN
ncbi:glycosyltransferase family 4 protein [Pedobacter chitinilyticus]|uniref:Glycosyltransferase n=1 Tax=Pedobacter chitinilyticus TaxID=2233776 RepID=A0A3S3PPD9_9SPHI|nr:glycosyltransferase family 4 protein [Pedobacter chitinilyticus]RWU08596.1 glycosyltransferase [Pedobacter chitinilyticus]